MKKIMFGIAVLASTCKIAMSQAKAAYSAMGCTF